MVDRQGFAYTTDIDINSIKIGVIKGLPSQADIAREHDTLVLNKLQTHGMDPNDLFLARQQY